MKKTTKTEKRNELLAAALSYAKQGWAVFPLVRAGKTPYKGSNGVRDSATSKRKIRQWWGETPEANIAIACGEVSGGLVVVDIDSAEAEKELSRLEAEHGMLPQTRQVQTARGRHLYFTSSEKVGNRIGLATGIDVRSNGGYVVAPPSVHPTGAIYEWQSSNSSVSELPAAWIHFINQTSQSDTETQKHRLPVSDMTLEQAIERTLPDAAGSRHRCVFSFARVLKAMPDFAVMSAKDLKAVVSKWHEAAAPMTSGNHTFDETWADFCHGWDRVRHPLGQGRLDEAMEAAMKSEVPSFAVERDQVAQDLIRLCRELQRRSGEKPFYLSVRACKEPLGIEKDKANHYLNMLCTDGVLDLDEKGKVGKASTYFYRGDPDKNQSSKALAKQSTCASRSA